MVLLSFGTCFKRLSVFVLFKRAVNFCFEITAFFMLFCVRCAVPKSEKTMYQGEDANLH